MRTIEEIRNSLIEKHRELNGRKSDLVNANPKLEAPKTKEYRRLTEEAIDVWNALSELDESLKKIKRLVTLGVIEI